MRSKEFQTVTIAVVLALSGCSREGQDQSRLLSKAPRSEPSTADPEAWISKPSDEWPQLVLTNQAEFNGHTPLVGASAFLIKTEKGRTLAGTAKHLIGVAGGVEPEIALRDLNGAIRSWRMYPRTLPNRFVSADGLGVKGLDDNDSDWLILTIEEPAETLPATPLWLRARPVEVGETVYMVGCPYVEESCKQNVYVGSVTAREGNLFRFDIQPPVDLRGFSGAPVIDRNGHVAGVIMLWFEPKMLGEKYLESGGEDAASIYDLVEHDP